MAQIDPRAFAPLISMGATWAVRKGMAKAYSRRTGEAPPMRGDTRTPLRNVLLWAMLTAMTTALIDVIIQQTAAKYSEQHPRSLDAPEAAQ
jgi:hypothetical protein